MYDLLLLSIHGLQNVLVQAKRDIKCDAGVCLQPTTVVVIDLSTVHLSQTELDTAPVLYSKGFRCGEAGIILRLRRTSGFWRASPFSQVI